MRNLDKLILDGMIARTSEYLSVLKQEMTAIRRELGVDVDASFPSVLGGGKMGMFLEEQETGQRCGLKRVVEEEEEGEDGDENGSTGGNDRDSGEDETPAPKKRKVSAKKEEWAKEMLFLFGEINKICKLRDCVTNRKHATRFLAGKVGKNVRKLDVEDLKFFQRGIATLSSEFIEYIKTVHENDKIRKMCAAEKKVEQHDQGLAV